MVTSRILKGGAFLAFFTGALSACTTQVAGGGTGGATGGSTGSVTAVTGTSTVTGTGAGGSGGGAYAGQGFIVHEWGTDTVVVGSDGSKLPSDAGQRHTASEKGGHCAACGARACVHVSSH